jgi:hypothetical protein
MKNIFILLSALTLFSCQKVIDITPDEGEVKVVIQGNLYNDSTAYVIVTKSTAYLSTTKPASISTATVTLSDGSGNSEVLTWNNTRERFETVAMKGVINETYTLTVTLEGKTYTSNSTLLYLDPVDSIAVFKEPATGFNEEGYYMKLYGTIPTNVDKYYLFRGYSNDSLLDGVNSINITDNKMITGDLTGGWDVGYECQEKETAKLVIYSLTLPSYNFFRAASIQLNNDGGFFSTPPANTPSMFSNDAVGLFQCSAIQVLTTYVDEQP